MYMYSRRDVIAITSRREYKYITTF